MGLVSGVQELLGETGGATFWTKAHIYDALNRVLFEEYGLSYESIVEGTAATVTGSEWMSVPSNVMIPRTITIAGKDYWPTTYAELERYSQYWRNEDAAQPIAFVPVSWNVLRVWPVPDANYTVIVRGTPWPTEIDATTEDISADELFKRPIELKAAALLVRNTLPQFAAMWEAEGKEETARWRKQQRLRKGQFRLNRLRPATTFTVGQHGAIATIKQWS